MSLHLPGDGRNDRKSATRRALLEAALTVFGEKGYHGAAVDDIVDKAGRSKGAAYFHFPSKEAIFRALIRELGKQTPCFRFLCGCTLGLHCANVVQLEVGCGTRFLHPLSDFPDVQKTIPGRMF